MYLLHQLADRWGIPSVIGLSKMLSSRELFRWRVFLEMQEAERSGEEMLDPADFAKAMISNAASS